MFRFSSFLFNAALSPKKLEALAKKYGMAEEKIQGFVEWDPTPNQAYLDWICREFKGSGVDESITEVLKKFNNLKNSPTFEGSKNIFDYTVESLTALFTKKLRHQLKDLSQGEIENKLKTEGLPGAKLVLNNGKWKMWKVTNYRYAMILGTGTRWCTANEGHAKSYCADGPLYPIYKNDVPFAQGYVGSSSIVLYNTMDNNFPAMDANLKDLLVAAEGIPEMAIMMRGVLKTLKSVTKKDMEFLQNIILETDDFGLLKTYLGKLYWSDGWELLLDAGTKADITAVLEKLTPTNGFFKSPHVEEVVDSADASGLCLLLPYFIEKDKLGLFFSKITEPVAISLLNEKMRSKLVDWIAKTIETSTKGQAIFKNIIEKISTNGLVRAGLVEFYNRGVIPWWKKFGEGERLSSNFDWNMMELCPEYSENT